MDVNRTLRGRRIVLGVTGGIAAYKTPLLVRLLRKAQVDVQVVMTRDAARFVTPLTLGTVSERDVLTDIFPDGAGAGGGSWTRHIELGLWADLLVVAPATAQSIARLAHGFCENMLTAVALAARCPLLVCPAMDHDMYVHPATKANLEILRTRGGIVMPPDHGELASGLIGEGRLPEPEAILERIASAIDESARRKGDLGGRRVLVTAGPTRELIDPVRYITNHSSGKMGYAIAQAAHDRGANVTLVSGPTNIDPPAGVAVVKVQSAAEMFDSVKQEQDADVIVMAAAVADYRPATPSDKKIKKTDGPASLALERTDDILAYLGERRRSGQVLVGFALETSDELAYARQKLEKKNVDMIVVNNPTNEGAQFGGDTNRVAILDRTGSEDELPVMPKARVAHEILDRVVHRLG